MGLGRLSRSSGHGLDPDRLGVPRGLETFLSCLVSIQTGDSWCINWTKQNPTSLKSLNKRTSRAIENGETAKNDKAKYESWKNETAESCT